MSENNKNNPGSRERESYSNSDLQGFHKAVPIILTAVAFIIFAGYLTEGSTGFGNVVSLVFKGLFGFGAWVVPVALILHSFFYSEDLGKGRIRSRIIFFVIVMIIASTLNYAIEFWNEPKANLVIPKDFTEVKNSGGYIGCALAWGLMHLFGPIGIIIISVAVIALYITFFYAGSNNAIAHVFFTVLEYGARFLAIIEKWIVDLVGRCKDAIQEKKQQKIDDRHAELVDDEYFGVDNGMKVMEIKELGIKESKNPEDFEDKPTLHNKIHMKSIVKEDPQQKVEEATDAPQEQPKPQKGKSFNLNYNFDHLKETAPKAEVTESPKEEPVEEPKKTPRNEFGLDDCAENIFTKDFDAFDFNAAEKIASRKSSKTPIKEKITPIYGDSIEIDTLTEEDVRRIREREILEKKMEEAKRLHQQRQREFEERKAALVKQFKDNPGSAYTTTENPVKGGAYTPKFTEYSNHSAKEDIFTVKENKILERQAAEIATRDSANASSSEVASTQSAPITSDTPAVNSTPIANPVPVVNPAPVVNQEPIASEAPVVTEAPATNEAPVASEVPGITEAPEPPKAEPKFNSEYAKTVAYNVSTEITHNPAENNSVQFTTHKYADTPDATAAILGAVGSKNPMYAMSENVINGNFSYTVKMDPEDMVTEKPATPPAEAPANEINTEDNETNNNTVNFSNYDPLTEEVNTEIKADDTLEVQRNMIDPDPVSFARGDEPKDVRPEPVTYATASHDSSDISASFSLVSSDVDDDVDEDNNTDGDEITWTEDNTTHVKENDDVVDGAIDGFVSADDDVDDIVDTDGDTDGDDDQDVLPFKEIPPEEQNPMIAKQRAAFSFLAEEDKEKNLAATQQTAPKSEPIEAPYLAEEPIAKEFPAPQPQVQPQVQPQPQVQAQPQMQMPIYTEPKPMPPAPVEKVEKPKPDFSNYKFPSVDLLISPPVEEFDYTKETQEKANLLISALESFSVTASIKGVDRGPRITRYEVVPARGVKVSSVLSLQDDIALQLAASSIRMEAPIPGKSAIGVEIPNDTSNTVYLKDLVNTAEFQNKKSKTAICIGKDVAGSPVFGDVAEMPHLLVAGATGMGKSVCMNAFMISLLYKATPEDVRFIMIDPKKVEFKKYNGIPHLLIPVVTENKQAAGALMWAVGEMERRYELIENLSVSNIDGYNKKVTDDPTLGEYLPRIIIVIDEFADLMLSVKDPVEKLVQSIAQKARAAGIHLIIGTQRPSVQIITGTIKANIPSRISCKVASFNDSRTILETSGAEKLLSKGDMLFQFAGAIKPIRVQGAFVSDGELDDVLSFVKSQSTGDNYNDDVLNEINKAAQKCSKKSGDSGDDGEERHSSGHGRGPLEDPEFLEAVDIALSQGQISTALLQRKLSIGFGKAARFIDTMEDIGLVSAKNGAKPRNVLLSRDEWIETYNRRCIE